MKLNVQISETEHCFGFTISQYILDKIYNLNEVLLYLLENRFFDLDIRPISVIDSLKNNPKYGELKGLFLSDRLSVQDFKYIEGRCIYNYLDGLSDSSQEWGEDKIYFKNLLNKFKEYTSDTINGCYIINKEWYNMNDDKVRLAEYISYCFYIVIIWLDKNDKSKLYVSEWDCD